MGGEGWLRRRWSAHERWAAVFAACVGLSVGCEDSGEIHGSVFVSGVKDSSGKTTGIAIDFVPIPRDADLTTIALEFFSATQFRVNDKLATHACLHLPTSGRRTLNASTAELMSDTRVTVIAKRRTVAWTDEVDHPGTAGTAGNSTAGGAGAANAGASGATPVAGVAGASARAGFCDGTYIDDAVWPSAGASIPPAPPMAGSSGTAASAGTAGNAGGTGGDGAGGAGDAGGAGGIAGEAGDGGMSQAGTASAPSGGSAGDAEQPEAGSGGEANGREGASGGASGDLAGGGGVQ